MRRWLVGGVLWVLAAGVVPAQAERGYATDACTVPVQSGPAPGYKIVRMVGSGTALEILEPNTKGYTKVKTPEGTSGWIMSEYLMNQPSARNRVGQLEARITALDNENQTLRSQTETLTTTRDASARCSEELAAVRQTAAQTLAIDEENHQLQQEVETSRERQHQLELENATLRDQSHRDWFIAGAGATFGGLLCGLIIPRLSWGRRQRRWDRL